MTITNFDGGGIEDKDGDALDINGTYAINDVSACTRNYRILFSNPCVPVGQSDSFGQPGGDINYMEVRLPRRSQFDTSTYMSLYLRGFRPTLCNGVLVTSHEGDSCGFNVDNMRYGIASPVFTPIVDPDDENLSVFMEFLCSGSITLTGSVTGNWFSVNDRGPGGSFIANLLDPCAGDPDREDLWEFTFDWELST